MSAKMDLNEPSSVDHSDEDEIHSASEDSDTGTEDDGNDVVDIGSGADNEDGEDADEVEPVSEVPEVVRPMEQRGAAAVVSRCGKRPSENLDYRRESGDGGAIGGRGSRLLRTLRRSGRRALAAGPIGRLISEASAGSSAHSPAWPSIDIVSLTIHCQMWHVTDLILSYLDAVSVKHCEDVCVLWRNYIRGENVWRKLTQRAVLRAPTLAFAVGWSRHLPALGGKEPRTVDEFKQILWKITNLPTMWAHTAPTEYKNHFRRTGSIVWSFLPCGRTVSVFNSGRGYTIKVHDNMTFRHRLSQKVTMGTVKKDTLCMDATAKRIAVGGLGSQKVWLFNVKERAVQDRSRWNAFVHSVLYGKGGRDGDRTVLSMDIFKFIHAGGGVSKVKLHSDDKRMAVLLPINQTVEVWDIREVVRLQSHSVPSDSTYLIWKSNVLLTAPLYSGVVQAVDSEKEREIRTLVGSIRRIDAVALYDSLIATAEARWVKLWSLKTGEELIQWCATKTHVTALLLNDCMVVTGSGAGIVKIWDLHRLMGDNVRLAVPMRKINMKGIIHYPIKAIHQWTYTDLVIVAKYESRKKKDKIKVVQLKGN